METENSINKQINDITEEIQDKYPELCKYLSELPVTIPDISKPHINLERLKDYYRSLVELRDRYATSHPG